MISLIDVEVDLGGRPILTGVNLQIREGERIAVVGRNGCGKSTMLRLIAGGEPPDAGEVNVPAKLVVGYLPQEANLEVSHSLQEELLSAFTAVQGALGEMAELEHEMAKVPPDSPAYDRVMQRYGELMRLVEHQDGYALETQVNRIATGLGFTAKDLHRSCQEFSGGWQMRILLAKLLLQKPDVMLLDEPTNHLDLESTLWLESWLRHCGRTVVMVSHERALMDRLAERIVSLDSGKAEVYRGNYSSYLEQSALKLEQWREKYALQQREIDRVKAFVARFRYSATRAPLVQSRVKQLERMEAEQVPPPPHATAAVHFNFPPAPASHREVIRLSGLSKQYGQHTVFSQVDLTIYRGERIGLVGVNGAGKSTLLRILSGREEPTAGKCELGGNVKMAYFAQYDTETLTSEQPLLSAIEATAPLGKQSQARNVLGAFLFSGDEVDKPLRALSGGERSRFRMAQMLFSPANLLLLDEPTNHLDVQSRGSVEKALQSYTGTVIVVSHDRVFMDRVTNRIIEIEDGKVFTYPGKYSEYAAYKELLAAQQEAESEVETKPVEANQSKHNRQRERDARKALSRKVQSAKRALEAVEREIEQQEARLKTLAASMSDPANATQYSKLLSLSGEHEVLQNAHTANLAKWEALQSELEELNEASA